MGSAVGPAGDVNGDGYADIVVSSDVLDETYTGKVLVYYGSATGLGRNNGDPAIFTMPIGIVMQYHRWFFRLFRENRR